jgi:hypothetical protein
LQARISNNAFVATGDGNGQRTAGSIKKSAFDEIVMLQLCKWEIEAKNVAK